MGVIVIIVFVVVVFFFGWGVVEIVCKLCMELGWVVINRFLDFDYDLDNEIVNILYQEVLSVLEMNQEFGLFKKFYKVIKGEILDF